MASGVINGTTSNQFIACKIEWTSTANVETNTSTVTAHQYYRRTNTGYTTQSDGHFDLSINGVNNHRDGFTTIKEDWVWVNSCSTEVEHDKDGSKSIVIACSGYVGGSSLSATYCSATVTLDTIPRSSSLALSVSSVNVGSSITANITRASTSFTHDVEFYINSTYYQKYTSVGTSQSFTIPTSWYSAMPSSTSCTAYCRITTYNGSTTIGDQVVKSFNVNVPTSIVPKIGSIALTPATINNNNILVKGKNALTVNVSSCEAGSGSSIKSYTFNGPSLNKTISSSSASSSTSISSVSSVGELTYTVTITDARGRTASKSATITCYDYYMPYFNTFSVYRADKNGNPNINGTYLQCQYTYSYASVNNTNNVSVKVYYNNNTSTNKLINLNGDVNTTYNVYVFIEDSYNGTNKSDTITVFGQSRILNITSDGTGVAIGKMAESSNLLECRWPAKFDDNVECKNISVAELSCTGLNCTGTLSADQATCNKTTSTTVECNNITINQKTIFDLLYPVGSIYMSTNNVSPKNLFGGTWEQLKDVFLLAAGSAAAGSTGGEKEHTLTVDETPKHHHDVRYSSNNAAINLSWSGSGGYTIPWTANGNANAADIITNEVGGGKAHNNMPPYLAVYMWKRTA